ncbi:DNA-directed RNA polymerase subunit alpha [Planctomycetota bacterium]
MRARWRGFELPTDIAVDKETLTPFYGKFTAEPFERGFGTTIGNSLRRVLLSSIEGAAVTRVRMDGVLHEFSSLTGIVEDVTDIVLNVKRLRVRVRSDEPRKLTIDVKKKGEVTAADIDPDPMVQVQNPDLHIATLSEEVPFKLEMEVQRGRGYVTAEENDSEDREIGVIPVDSVYSPVQRVRYRTENTRVGQLTDYDKLIVELWTDGTIQPEEALVEAGKILRKHLMPIVNYTSLGSELEAEAFQTEEAETEEAEEDEAAEAVEPQPEETPAQAAPEIDLSQRIRDLGLSVRAVNALEGNGIETLGDLVVRTEDELLTLRNFGKTTLKEVQVTTKEMGLKLGMEQPVAEPA